MNCRFQHAAEDQLNAAADYYYAIRPELALRFKDEAKKTVARISENPRAWWPLTKRLRSCPIHGFPYAIIYHILRDEIEVVAVAHGSRKPFFWRKRRS
jgi:toxin ParE1/3/4